MAPKNLDKKKTGRKTRRLFTRLVLGGTALAAVLAAPVFLEERRIGDINDGKCNTGISLGKRMEMYARAEYADFVFNRHLDDFMSWLSSPAGKKKMLGFRQYEKERGGYMIRDAGGFYVKLINSVSNFPLYASEIITGNFQHKDDFIKFAGCAGRFPELPGFIEEYIINRNLEAYMKREGTVVITSNGKNITINDLAGRQARINEYLQAVANSLDKESLGMDLNLPDSNGFYSIFHYHPVNGLPVNPMSPNDLKLSRYAGPSVMISFYPDKAEVYCAIKGKQRLLITYRS
jgi:hypothetical protein